MEEKTKLNIKSALILLLVAPLIFIGTCFPLGALSLSFNSVPIYTIVVILCIIFTMGICYLILKSFISKSSLKEYEKPLEMKVILIKFLFGPTLFGILGMLFSIIFNNLLYSNNLIYDFNSYSLYLIILIITYAISFIITYIICNLWIKNVRNNFVTLNNSNQTEKDPSENK